jgi:biopolymer transport protein ExbD
VAQGQARQEGVRRRQGRHRQHDFLCPEGLVILQADEDTDARIITMVVTTAKYANFDNILFAVKKK